VRVLVTAWLVMTGGALVLAARPAWEMTHDAGLRARYRSRGDAVGFWAGIAAFLVISALVPPLVIFLAWVGERPGRGS
jgi:hypothetical protein